MKSLSSDGSINLGNIRGQWKEYETKLYNFLFVIEECQKNPTVVEGILDDKSIGFLDYQRGFVRQILVPEVFTVCAQSIRIPEGDIRTLEDWSLLGHNQMYHLLATDPYNPFELHTQNGWRSFVVDKQGKIKPYNP